MDETTLTIGIDSMADAKQRILAALRSEQSAATPRYTFQSAEDLARTLTPGRWGLIAALTGAGPLGVRELARRVGRDVKGVHTDAQALVLCGLVDKTRDGKLSFPYRHVKVQFELHARAA
jgi:predicted transcriptional regulator